MFIDEKYKVIKNIVAKTYGVTLNEDGYGDRAQTNSFTLKSLITMKELEDIFNNLNLYTHNSVKNAKFIIELCFEKSHEVAKLYHKMFMMYNLDNIDTAPKQIINELNTLLVCQDDLKTIYSKHCSPSLFNGADNDKIVISEQDKQDNLIFLFNIYLCFFIRQINDEIFKNGLAETINIKQHTSGNQ